MSTPQSTQLPTGVIVVFAIVFPAGLVFAPVLAAEAVADSQLVRAEGVVVETRVVHDPTPSRSPARWCKEWQVDYGPGRQWFRVRRYLNEEDVEVEGDVGKTRTVWHNSGRAVDSPPEPHRKAFQAVFVGAFGVVGLIAIGALVQRLMGRDRPRNK